MALTLLVILCTHHTDDGLCRVAMPPSNNYDLSLLKPISRCQLLIIFKVLVHCTEIHQWLRQLTDFSR